MRRIYLRLDEKSGFAIKRYADTHFLLSINTDNVNVITVRPKLFRSLIGVYVKDYRDTYHKDRSLSAEVRT